MIIYDTETTGLIISRDAPLDRQPKIIELFALKVDDVSLEIQEELELLIDPGEAITDEIRGITGIDDSMVRGQGQFPMHAYAISEFWLGQRWSCGHNLTFDASMLSVELRRIGAQEKFPWTPRGLCTVEASEHYEGRRMKLIDLHTYLLGEGFEKAHRARNDVMATYRCVVEMAKRGDIEIRS